MPAEGLDWLPTEQTADRRRGRPAGHHRRRAARRPRGALHRRRAAAAPGTGRHRGAYARARRRDVADHQRPRAWRAPPGPAPTPASTGSTSASTRCGRRPSRRSPGATGSTTWSPGSTAATRRGLGPIKVNAVLLRGINDDQAAELLRWAVEHGYELRFIEQMPLDAQHDWSRDGDGHRRRDLRPRSSASSCSPRPEPRGSAPAELFLVDGGPATVGVIASVTRPFCGDCDRVRLTADGQVRNCLFAREESDLRAALRGGAEDEEIAERWRRRDARQARRPRHRRPAIINGRSRAIQLSCCTARGYRRNKPQIGVSDFVAPPVTVAVD